MQYGFVCPDWAKSYWNPTHCSIEKSTTGEFCIVDHNVQVTVYAGPTREDCEDWLNGARNLGSELVNNEWGDEGEQKRLNTEFQECSKRNMEQAEKEYSMQGSYDRDLPPLFPPQDEQDDPEVGLKLSELLELRTNIATLYQEGTDLREKVIRGQIAIRKEQLERETEYHHQVELKRQRDEVTEDLRQTRNKYEQAHDQISYMRGEMDRLNRKVQEQVEQLLQAKRAVMQAPGSFEVKLTSFGANKIHAIKGIRVAREIGLKDAKDLVESAPVVLAKGVSWDAAQALIKEMTPTYEWGKVGYGSPASPKNPLQFVVTKIR